MSNIHTSAVVEDGAKIADNVTIGAFAYISSNANLKAGVEIMQGAGIYGNTTIEENTKVFPYAIIGTPPQDTGYKAEDDVKVIIGKNCTIREFVTVNAGTKKGGGITSIGDDCFIMIYSHIAHDCQVGNNVTMANNATLAGHVHIGSFTVIGGMTPIHQFVKIGEGCMIGGASAISQDIPPFCLAEGNRAVVKGLNAVGLKRRFKKEDIRALQGAYRELFRSNMPIKDMANELLKNEKNEKVLQMCSFIVETSRGIPYERKNNG
ncbi:acyl-ACP--UDP-N-acetylglucosamine O-acyltransferase [Sulfurospirillum arcachonense]|uniref:acyl-ACP--UDP-N-acetylglucosamine O-acyltransferase n=1 Tax=Sulfurospirillum arcachonense TaxID=57666 RepID=UPI000468AD60|nr:acyl-ACP--UDP-N-acetylglucosamine O-acyltransferase [Sulfurospirillum arcachonense]